MFWQLNCLNICPIPWQSKGFRMEFFLGGASAVVAGVFSNPFDVRMLEFFILFLNLCNLCCS